MRFLRKLRFRLIIGLVAIGVTMTASPLGGRMLGEFPLWIISWVSSMVSFIALTDPILGLAQAAKKAAKETNDEEHP